MFSQVPTTNSRIFFKFFSCFLLKQGRIFSIDIKNDAKTVAKTLFLQKKRHFADPLKETKTFFVKKKSWIRRFGIRENMSRADVRRNVLKC